jgi:hypothetical protein
MIVERMVGEVGALRRDSGSFAFDGEVAAALEAAAASVEALSPTSDEDAILSAWRAVDRAGAAVARVQRIARRRHAPPAAG